MDLMNEKIIQKINELAIYWKSKSQEFENMEISPSDATRWRAGFRMQSRSLTFEFPKNSNNWGFQRKLDQIQNDVDIAITKGQNNFRNNENLRFSQKYGNIIGPALSAITAFFMQ
jgi:hypothetical protein